jgi:hypothetical protein
MSISYSLVRSSLKNAIKILIPLTGVILLSSIAFTQASQEYTGKSIEEILRLPEDQIDTGHACLILAKDAYPDLNIAAFDQLLDEMAGQINASLRGRNEPEQRIGIMNTYLYRPGWWNGNATFEYNRDDLLALKKESQFLNGYLATRKGACLTMAMLYLALADRLGWPIRAVRAPSHYFCRYAGMKDGNIEATSFGGFSPDSATPRNWRWRGTRRPRVDGFYLPVIRVRPRCASWKNSQPWLCAGSMRMSSRA